MVVLVIVQLSLSLRTKILCISGVTMNNLAPMKNCPGGRGGGGVRRCEVGHYNAFIFQWIFFIPAGNKDNYNILDGFEFQLDPTSDCGVPS